MINVSLLQQYKQLKRDDGARSGLNEEKGEKDSVADHRARRAAVAARTKKRALEKVGHLKKCYHKLRNKHLH